MEDSAHRKKTTIHDLDDHVLRLVFEHLEDFDLPAIANVCTTFKHNAQAVFSLRYKSRTYWFYPEGDDRFDLKGNLRERRVKDNLPKLRSILQNFGALINSLSIGSSGEDKNHSQEIMDWINRYCGAALKSLTLFDIWLTSSTIIKIQPLLSGLQEIDMDGCRWESTSWTDISQMFSFCSELKSLWFTNPRNFDGESFNFQVRVKIPKLVTFGLEQCYGIKKKSIEKFLKMNPQLQDISINECTKITSRILPSVVMYAPRLEWFSFSENVFTSDFLKNAKSLKHLSALKELHMSCDFQSISSFIVELGAARIPLETLSLAEFNWDEKIATGMVGLQKLKTLDIMHAGNLKVSQITKIVSNLCELVHLTVDVDDLTATNLVEILRCGPKLGYLNLFTYHGGSITIDTKLYMEILAVVVKRKEKCHLKICFLSSDEKIKLNVSEELLQANQESLQIRI